MSDPDVRRLYFVMSQVDDATENLRLAALLLEEYTHASRLLATVKDLEELRAALTTTLRAAEGR